MMATFAHAGIFLIRDYTSTPNIVEKEVIGRILPHKGAILSHLSWICLWLGFHTLGVYIHNDTAFAFCEQEKQILIEPVFAHLHSTYFLSSSRYSTRFTPDSSHFIERIFRWGWI
jgi:photosystem I P700 chlorophyll a apoprotein A2